MESIQKLRAGAVHALLLIAAHAGFSAPAVAAPSEALAGRTTRCVSPFSRYFKARRLPITYGFEIEMNILDNPNLILDYRLSGHSEAEWLALPPATRTDLAAEWEAKNRHIRGKVAYYKLSGRDEKFPAFLTTEGNGNVEMKGLIFSDFSEASRFVEDFVERYGRASFQGHVVFPRNATPGAAGYTLFEADRAQLKTLEINYQRHLENPSVVPGKNLAHHSLGPLGQADGKKLRELESAVGRGERIGDPGSTRIIYGPTFRGDIYPRDKVGYELRQFHNRHEELLEEMGRLSDELETESSLSRYRVYENIELIHAGLPQARAAEFGIVLSANWTGFFREVGSEIRKPFPALAYGAAPPSERFFFPLRNWTEHPIILALPAADRARMVRRIRRSTRSFLENVNQLVQRNQVTPATLKDLQILNARWAYESGLAKYFER